VGALAEETNPGTFVYYIRLDDDASADRTATFVGNLTIQVEKVCTDLASHPVLSKAPAINGLGFSQGGQFLRAYVERCNFPPMANLVTFGSQHNGISEFQICDDNDWICKSWEGVLKRNTWSHFVQSKLVPAQYYRDPDDLKRYLESSNFLADINNERTAKNYTYKKNMMKLEKFAMYMFKDDKTVVPKQSAWFGELDSATGIERKLQDRKIYQEDWIGLRWLDEKNRLEFPVTPGGHMELPSEVLVEAFKKYFRPRSKSELAEDSKTSTG
jgi:palmitoyl-protein thioesterase